MIVFIAVMHGCAYTDCSCAARFVIQCRYLLKGEEGWLHQIKYLLLIILCQIPLSAF